jgi:hypothetical protein
MAMVSDPAQGRFDHNRLRQRKPRGGDLHAAGRAEFL